jgi:SAM-dependent methyltransferase
MTVNRVWWDERAALHGQDPVYDTEAFLAGHSTLRRLDHEAVGDVAGLDVVHLQCHTGMDTLSWLRAGARSVAGVDFSPVAIAKAEQTAAAAGLSDRASFVVADVLDVPADLRGRFDVCYASRGVLCWIGDLDRWMGTAYDVLRPGGRLALVELHPLFQMVDSVEPLRLDFPYRNDGPRRFDASGSYALPDAKTVHNETVEWAHSLGEVVTAAAAAGFVVERLTEEVVVESEASRGVLPRGADGLFRWERDGELLPVMFTLTARKPAG